VLPFILLWKAPGEVRSRLALCAELILVYIPLTAGSQLTYELPFLLGHPFNLWGTTSDPGWRWLWWQYGLADTRYRSDNMFIFGLEFGAVLVGILLFVLWMKMLRRDLPRRITDPLPVAELLQRRRPGCRHNHLLRS